ncbi:hypothetical protein HPT27_18535 [Permianibacter sp. IMCC34836]|uniref:hypothetical protein n=1 Tax=Permianibacter fluminis TaxID=2738515 RepID=UPI001556DD53|nr:hypothetical protein [Permianibacter fluminis]NQD39018.1 hypothetical protein [Permianibacter fluminis]
MNKTRASVAAVAIIVVSVVLFILSRKFHYVDSRPATALADAFFNDLQKGDVDRTFQKYDARYIDPKNGEWLRLLQGLNSRYGPITSYLLANTAIVPVADIGCSLLHYNIHRAQLITEENLIVCPTSQDSNNYLIVGHSLHRMDTDQSIVVGLSVHEERGRVP